MKFKFDADTDKVIMIKKQLENNEDLKRVTCNSEQFHQITNHDFNIKLKSELD
jgi:hypothetical protein